jgi:biotin carboxyl carrier protein
MALVEVKVPDIGDFKDVAVIELLVKPGDTVKPEQSLVTVESDKASMEIPSTHGGVVKEMKVALGDKVNEGSVLLLVESAGDAAAAPAAAPAPAAAAPSPAAPAPAPAAAPAAAAGPIEVTVPDIGDFKDVAVIELLVKPGDTVKAEQSLITVESDKASMEIPLAARRRGEGAEGRAGRQGQPGHADRGARRRRRIRCPGERCRRRGPGAYGDRHRARARYPVEPAGRTHATNGRAARARADGAARQPAARFADDPPPGP